MKPKVAISPGRTPTGNSLIEEANTVANAVGSCATPSMPECCLYIARCMNLLEGRFEISFQHISVHVHADQAFECRIGFAETCGRDQHRSVRRSSADVPFCSGNGSRSAILRRNSTLSVFSSISCPLIGFASLAKCQLPHRSRGESKFPALKASIK